jgi:hypothetical protein
MIDNLLYVTVTVGVTWQEEPEHPVVTQTRRMGGHKSSHNSLDPCGPL